MKKFIFSVLAIGLMVGASAQTTVFSENFDSGIPSTWTMVDADGDGLNWATHSSGRNSTSCASSASWDYNTQLALTPDNWLISPQIAIPSGQNTLVWYSDAQDDSWPEDKYSVYVSATGSTPADFTATTPVFTEVLQAGDWTIHTVDLSAYAGQSIYVAFRHYDCTDMFVMKIDDISITNGALEIINVSAPNLAFGYVQVGSSYTSYGMSITTVGLTNPVSVTTSAPFEVSNDGTSFATTATIPATGGSLYVKFTPTAVGLATGTVSLTSGSGSATISLTGSGYECLSAYDLPFIEDFETSTAYCWTYIDADGDGVNWFVGALSETEHVAASYSWYNTALTPDNWIVSPALNIPAAGATIQWSAAALDDGYPEEKYGVFVSTTNNDPNSFTELFTETLESSTYVQHSVSIPAAFANQQVYIAFRHFDCTDMFALLIDNIAVTEGTNGLTNIDNINNVVSVYPNPVSNVLTLNSAMNMNRVEIYNVLGQKVFEAEQNGLTTSINVEELAAGNYVARIFVDGGVATKNVVIK
ncbi:MAG: choice-of-anchor J domain-containing protein [Bacteroidales bacterium]|jgi:hypothetical protein|nr:choice-of-anchor J domain-containing protein [Bacteroidales bacterium]